MGNPNGWLAAPLLAPTKSTARHEKPHIFFHSIDWLFDIHMNVFIYSMASEMALYLAELYSFCIIAVRGYNLNIAAKTSSSGLQIHTYGKSTSTIRYKMSCFFIECPPVDVSVTNCNSGRKYLYRLDVMICDVSRYAGVDVILISYRFYTIRIVRRILGSLVSFIPLVSFITISRTVCIAIRRQR